jgi:hypothetical protein
METSQSAKTSLGHANALQIGKHDASRIAHDDRVHRAPSVDQDSDLTVDFPRELGQGAGEVVADDGTRRDALLVDLLEAPTLSDFEPRRVAL